MKARTTSPKKERGVREMDARTPLVSGAPASARVLSVEGPDHVLVRLDRKAAEEVLRAQIAVMGYSACEGDRVLVTPGEEELYVVGVLGDARRRVSASLGPNLTVRSVGENAVELIAEVGDLTLSAKGKVTLNAGVELVTEAPKVSTTANEVVEHVGRHERTAERIVESAQNVFTNVTELLQTTAGRTRTIVEGDCDVHAGRTAIVSSEDTLIDGKRVLLG
ncbi:MAG: DUF3540 domain-containing protein [Polyangiaceae bacterium]|nr:DUF3540 domain-containing protein [Polyangiaceae bacterium]